MQQLKNENLKILAKRIKELRIQKSKSLNKFVFSRGNITSATWSRIENALVDLKFTTLLQVAVMLDLKVDELLEGIEFNYGQEEE